jgi:sulfur carrier protein ThiS
VKVKVVAPVALPGLDSDGRLEVPEKTRVRDILKRSKVLAPFLTVLPMMVNGKQVKVSHLLNDGDVLVIVFPIHGG